MFVRFRQTGDRVQVSLVEPRRVVGKVRQEHIAGLGSVDEPQTVEGRLVFWRRAGERLEALGNRIGPDAERIFAALHDRIPVPSDEEQRHLKIEAARSEERVFNTLAEFHRAAAADSNQHAAVAKAEADRSLAGADMSEQHAATARERIARIEAGEEVAGASLDALTEAEMLDILKKAGMTDANIRLASLTGALAEIVGAERLPSPVQKKLCGASPSGWLGSLLIRSSEEGR
jgi:hypothetical protein